MTTNETQRAAPKPWSYGTGSEGFPVFDGRDRLIAHCYDYTESDDPAEPHDHAAEANARLMAAAPQMFGALQEIARLNSLEALRAGRVLSVSLNVAALALTAIVVATEPVPSSAPCVLCDPYPESVIRDSIAGYDALEVHPVRSNPQPDGSTWCQPCAAQEADIWSVYARLADGGCCSAPRPTTEGTTWSAGTPNAGRLGSRGGSRASSVAWASSRRD